MSSRSAGTAATQPDKENKASGLNSSILTSRSSSFYHNLSKHIKTKPNNSESNQTDKHTNPNNNNIQHRHHTHNINNINNKLDWAKKILPDDHTGKKLLSALIAKPNAITQWKTFLEHIETNNYHHKLLADWYGNAIESLPSTELRKHPDFIAIALRWASKDIAGDAKEAKSRCKWMAVNRVGMADAKTYIARARTELELSGFSKAKKIIDEGIARNAQPVNLLLDELSSLSDRRKSIGTHNDSSQSDIDISVKSLTCDVRIEDSSLAPEDIVKSAQECSHSNARNSETLPERKNRSDVSANESVKRTLFEDQDEYEKNHDIQKSISTHNENFASTPDVRQKSDKRRESHKSCSGSTHSSSSGGSVAALITPAQPKRVVRFKSSEARTGHITSPRTDLGTHAVKPIVHHVSDPIPATSSHSASTAPAVQPFIVNGKCFHRLELVGKGGSGKVYKVIGDDLKIYALKKIRFNPSDHRSIEGFMNEIQLLKLLKNKPNIIQMFDCMEDYDNGVIFMLFEFGEIDLAKTLKKRNGKAMNVNYIKTLWQQMLEAVQTIHEARIVHGDLKPANFLFVSGDLKLIDFGIAKALQNDTTHIERDTQIGTVNYMSPEAILASEQDDGSSNERYKLTRSSDIWSLGCILYQMVYGKTPFQDIQKTVMKLYAIADPHYPINFPDIEDTDVIDVLKRCLRRNPRERPTIPELLEHPFLSRTSTTATVIEVNKVQKFLLELQKKGVLDSNVDHQTLSKELLNQIEKS